MQLTVYIQDTRVGSLERSHDGSLRLRFSEAYRKMARRPVLGQFYVDKLHRVPAASARIPSFFANLLPEGALRQLLATAAGVGVAQEYGLLAHLGEDLPGAVRVIQTDGESAELDPSSAVRSPQGHDRLRFSLAGVQLKFSMVRYGKGLVLPTKGRDGDWLVKLPDFEFQGVPENEFATMEWARASGIETSTCEMVTFAMLEGIPDRRFVPAESLCFATRRFDRPVPGTRVHIEDFAQVFGRYPEDKYDDNRPTSERLNYESLARVISVLCGEDDLRAFVRRLVFTVLCGNADAHLKNWSFIYADGRAPRLSPAYDQVCTIMYPGTSDVLALPFFGSPAFEDVSPAAFRRLAGVLRRDPDELAAWAAEDVTRIMDAWTGSGIPRTLELRFAIDQHHRRLGRTPGSLLHP